MKIALGCDHAGYVLSKKINTWLENQGYEVTLFGADSPDSYDYPQASDGVAKDITSKNCELGILVCGSGIGVCIRANRYPGIRAAECKTAGQVKLAREHNHLNVLCLAGRVLTEEEAIKIVENFIETPIDNHERIIKRISMLDSNISN